MSGTCQNQTIFSGLKLASIHKGGLNLTHGLNQVHGLT